ncbi:hypothetical protein [uncultured Campylobacter sp.]|uniref:hypothetical protein n=1 Tax=uncultured Campylobacter sp. TaxID=218934 RepID=UPI002629AE7A|nr:hypothetical protein [uncultured Campylobacter sp.]
MSRVTAKIPKNLTQILKSAKIRAILNKGILCKIAHFKTFAIGSNNMLRLIEEFSKLKDIGKRVDAGLEGDIDKI